MRRRLSSPARFTSGNPDENHPSGSRLYEHAAGMRGYKIGSPSMSHDVSETTVLLRGSVRQGFFHPTLLFVPGTGLCRTPGQARVGFRGHQHPYRIRMACMRVRPPGSRPSFSIHGNLVGKSAGLCDDA